MVDLNDDNYLVYVFKIITVQSVLEWMTLKKT